MPKCPKCGEMNPAGVGLCKNCGSQIPLEDKPQPEVAPGGFEAEVLELLRGDKKIEAIKVYREKTGIDLKEAKDAVEALAKKHNLTSSGVGCASVLLILVVAVAIIWRLM